MILVVGANGRIGREVVRGLAQRGLPVKAMVRSRMRATAVEGLGVPLATGDLARAECRAKALAGVDRAVLVSSTCPGMPELHGTFAAAAREAGLAQVVRISACGAAPDAGCDLLRWHAEAEARLEASGVGWTHLRINYLVQNVLELAPLVAARGVLAAPAGAGRAAMVDVRDVAAAAIAAVLAPAAHLHATYELTGPEALDFAAVAAHLAAATGRPVRYLDTPPDQARAAWARGQLEPWRADAMVGYYGCLAAGRLAAVSGDLPRLLGRPARPFAAFARQAAAQFGGDEAATGSE